MRTLADPDKAARITQAYEDYRKVAVLAPLRAQSPLVPGDGPLHTPVMLIGEAPGADEAERGRPFTGRSGKLLWHLLHEQGLKRWQCYVTNVLLYRPPGNRRPEAFEIAASRERLFTEIEVISPALIVTLGATARKATCPQGDPVSACHGRLERLGQAWCDDEVRRGAPLGLEASLTAPWVLLPTFHPSAALRDEEVMTMMKEDLAMLGAVFGG